MPPPEQADRFARIDVLRGAAIAVVVLHHFLLAFTMAGVPAELVPALGGLNRWLFLPHELGYLGVKLFFVVSGFCIHNSYLGWRRRTAAPTPQAFLLSYINRRFWRIYPPYLLALLLAFTIAYWPQFDARAFRHLAFNASLTNTLSEAFFFNINPAFWSVAAEWQLYLAYPLVLWLNRRLGPWPTMACTAATAAFWHFGLPHITTNWALLHLPVRWWFEWCLGFLVAELLARGRVAVPRAGLATALLLAATIVALTSNAGAVLAWLIPPLAFAAALQAACNASRPLGVAGRAAAAVGTSSYSLYLLHNPIIWGLVALLGPIAAGLPPWVTWLPLFLLAFVPMQAAAWLMFRTVEQPSIEAGRNLERSLLHRLLSAGAPNR